ncbi:MAG: type II toxin-antitoxin system RelE/ParE family toxin [Gammaproteobacteria bacterium]
MKALTVAFFRAGNGTEPVREWLKTLDDESRRYIGADLKTVEYGWPLGMPLVRKLDAGLWELRSHASHQRIARLLFTVHIGRIVLVHGFIKKTSRIRPQDMELAKIRRNLVCGDYS